jgi:pimeloyl-ACP methyl ester carboxylesterase
MALLRAPAHVTEGGYTRPQPLHGQDRLITLSDGRQLGYSETGRSNGRAVLFFHGFGTTRVVCPPAEAAEELGVRLIAVDRPGIGLSDPKPGRRLLDWPSDVAELADHLDLESLSIVGWSGGGPYALGCAFALGSRVSSVAVVSSPAPLAGTHEPGYLRRFDRNAVRAADRAPWMIRVALWHWGRGQRRDAARFFERSVADMCAADQEVLTDPALRGRMIANSTELYRQGGRGMYDEALILARPWGFDLFAVTAPVHIWQGEQDPTVPPPMSSYLARAIPGARTHLFPDEGHHLLYSRWSEILAALE